MNPSPLPSRRIAGWTCVAVGFALVVLLGLGVIGPGTGDPPPASLGAALMGLVPTLALAVVAFVAGLLLLRGGRGSTRR